MDFIDRFFLANRLKKYDFCTVPDLRECRQTFDTDFIWSLLNYRNFSGYHSDISLTHILIVGKCKIPKRVPITDLYGSNHGKSDMHNSTEEFANSLKVYPRGNDSITIYFETDEDFEKNIKSIEDRYSTPYDIYQFGWNGRKFLANGDQSHHVAAVYRQCKAQNRTYGINSFTTNYSIDKQSLRAFDDAWQVYAVVPSKESRDSFICDIYKYQRLQRLICINHLDIEVIVLFVQKRNSQTKFLLSLLKNLELQDKSVDVSKLLRQGAN